MNLWKSAMLGAIALGSVACLNFASAFAQSGMTAPPPAAPPAATHKFRRDDVYAMMTKVSREVWRAKYSGASAQHMQELFLDGQRAYFKGDYDAAMGDFMAADKIYKKYPNAITPD